MTKPLIIKHWVACTPAEVWHAWTTPELFRKFISPEGLSVPLESVVMDLHIGGRVAFDMVFDDTGVVNENSGTIEEIVDNPEVLEAFRSSYRKLGRVLGVATENRDPSL